jgi:hypothetical protein
MTHPSRAMQLAMRRFGPCGLIVAVLVLGCVEGPFSHTNPLDPDTPLDFEIVGAPDTIAFQQQFQLTIQSNPPLREGTLVLWVGGTGVIRSFGGGNIEAQPTLRPDSGMVRAMVGMRSAIRWFHAQQRVASIDVACRIGVACDTLRYLGQPLELDVSGRDEGGLPLKELGYEMGRSLTVSSDVVEFRDIAGARVTVVARSNGTTWARISVAGVSDSVMVAVRQRLRFWQNACPSAIPVDTTVQLTTTGHRDAGGSPIETVTDEIRWLPGEAFSYGTEESSVDATVLPDGTFTGHAPGYWRTYSYIPGIGPTLECLVEILPRRPTAP